MSHQTAIGGSEAAPQGRRLDSPDRLRHCDEVEIGSVDHDEVGERAGAGEPGLSLIRTHLGIAFSAVFTAAAAAYEWRGDSRTDSPASNLGPYLSDATDELVSGSVRQPHRIVATPGMPI